MLASTRVIGKKGTPLLHACFLMDNTMYNVPGSMLVTRPWFIVPRCPTTANLRNYRCIIIAISVVPVGKMTTVITLSNTVTKLLLRRSLTPTYPTPRSPCPHTLPFPIIASPFVFALTIPDGHGGARVQRNSKAQDVLRRHRECFEVKDGQPVYQEKQDLILRQG